MARRRFGRSYDEDEAANPRALWRFGIWGAVAFVALGAALIAVRIDGTRAKPSLEQARAPTGAQLPVRSFDPETDARRLNEAVRLLAADRDRLLARISALERNHDDITGSVPKNPVRPLTPPASAAQPMSAPAPTTAPARATTAVPAAPGPPRVASVPAADPGPAASVATKTEFGIDLGGAGSLEGLRNLWNGLRDRHEVLLEGLRPIIAIREGMRPGVVELHLVAGPLANASAAARLCAALAAAGLTCQPTVFDGQRLALR